MCGIGLFVDIQDHFDKEELMHRMCDVIAHRGPDHFGHYSEGSVAIGHRRLSILDLSEKGNQPFIKWGLVVSFNGEIYNYIEVRLELQALGYVFETDSDTEVLLAAYDHWKLDCFQHLNGMWAVIIYDLHARKIILCRDRFGIKPLVYTKSEEYFAAGSEPKQLLQVGKARFPANTDAIRAFVLLDTLNEDGNTFWKNIQDVLPGHYLEYSLLSHSFISVKWYELEERKVDFHRYENVLTAFRTSFLESLQLIARSDVEIATLLSGGLDSSLILCGLKELGLLNKVTSSFSSCFLEKEYSETEYIDCVANQVGLPSKKVFPLDYEGSYHELIRKMVYHHDQPLRSPSHLSEYFVFKMIHENGYKVALGGQGVDEYMGGYKEFPFLYASGLREEHKYSRLMKFIVQRSRIEDVPVRHIAMKYAGFIRSLQRESVSKPAPNWVNENCRTYYSKSFSLPSRSFDGLVMEQIEKTSFPYQLHSEDRNAMMFSIESRQPFLDYKLVELGVSIPFEFKMKGGWSKSILRDAFPELPEKVRLRKNKLGFPFPDDAFLKRDSGHIASYLQKYKDIYSEYLDPETMGQISIWDGKSTVHLNQRLLFRLYTLCVWHETFFVKGNNY
jgi:asparagine synthase (glutamine-hydrolysing)